MCKGSWSSRIHVTSYITLMSMHSQIFKFASAHFIINDTFSWIHISSTVPGKCCRGISMVQSPFPHYIYDQV